VPGYHYSIDQTQVENGDNKILPCLGSDTSFVKQQSHSFTAGAWSWVSITDNEISLAAYPLSTVSINIIVNYLCAPDNAFLPFKIDGQAAICDASKRYTYQVKAAPWTGDEELQKVFPVVAQVIRGAGSAQLQETFRKTETGWVAVDLL
jgi:hypothetical protein